LLHSLDKLAGNNGMNTNVYIHIPFSTIIRIVLAVIALLFVFIMRDIIILLLFAIVIAAAVDPLATKMENRGVPRIVGLLLVYLAFFLGVISFFWALIPPLAIELTDFTANFPIYATGLIEFLSRYGITSNNHAFSNLPTYVDRLTEALAQLIPTITGIFTGIVGRGLQIITVFLASFYLALQRNGEEKFLRMLSSNDENPYIVDLWKRAQIKIGQWLQGQVILAVLIGIATYVGLTILGVKYALILAIIAGLLEVVPIVGPIATAIVAMVVVFFQAPGKAILVGIFFLILQQIEGNILVPLIFRKVLGLHPVIVIFSLLVGLRLGGLPGMLLAVPVAAVLTELISDFSSGKVKL